MALSHKFACGPGPLVLNLIRDGKEVPSDTGPVNPLPPFLHALVTTTEKKIWMDPGSQRLNFLRITLSLPREDT